MNTKKQTIGVLGGGQLGRMLAQSAKAHGQQIVVFSSEAGSPAGQIADKEIVGDYVDKSKLTEFSKLVDAVTYEFENIPLETAEFLEKHVPVRPSSKSLKAAQHRLYERELLTRLNIPVADHRGISSADDCHSLSDTFPFPAILKTATSGYDGKGQIAIQNREGLHDAWISLNLVPCLLEEQISFTKEFSTIIARGEDGSVAHFGPIENEHRRHILSISQYPGSIPEKAAAQAKEHAEKIAHDLEHIGVLTVEFFLLNNGEILVNELAPRPHNSGHLTIEAATSSQFDQQLFTTSLSPLGSFSATSPAAGMINLLGDIWNADEPDFSTVQKTPGASLHLYGKSEARRGRKMGHITVLASSKETLEETILVLAEKYAHER